MSVVISVEDTGVCRKQVTVEVPADAVGAETQRLVTTYAQEASLPGFRKGKTPRSLIRQRFREEIDRAVVESLIPRYWEKAREEKDLSPLGQPQLQEVGDLKEGEPLRFVAVVEVRPSLDLAGLDPEDIELPEVEVEPSEEDVDTALEEMRRHLGDWKSVERPAARGDQVVARVIEETPEAEEAEEAEAGTGTPEEAGAESEGEAEEEGQQINVEVGDPKVWEELSLAVTGLAAGQEGRFTRRPPEPGEAQEGGAAEAAPRTFRVRVEEVQERELPALDDDLARQVGEFESVEELRKAMADKLRHDRGHERDSRRREALMEQLRERYPTPLPEGVIHEESQAMLNEYAQDVARRGIDPAQAGIDWNRMGEQMRPMAERRLHDRLLMDAVADLRDVQVTPTELQAAVGAIARSQGITTAQVRDALGDRMEGLARQIRREKAMKWLMGEEGAEEEAGAEATEAEATETPEATDAETTDAEATDAETTGAGDETKGD